MHTRALITLLGVCAGILVGELSLYGSEVAVTVLVLGILQVSLYFFAVYRYSKRGVVRNRMNIYIPLLSGIFCIALFVGVIRVQFDQTKTVYTCEKTCTFAGVVVTDSKVQDTYQIFSVHPDNEVESYDVQVKVPLYPQFKIGDRLLLSGKVTKPSSQMEHAGKKSFDYSMYLQIHNIGSEMLYPKVDRIKNDSSASYTLSGRLAQTREFFLTTVFIYVSGSSASLASGMLFGDSSMSKELVQTFRVAGLSHIIVLSGFNIAVLISFVVILLRVVPLFIRICIAGIFVVLFVLMVGAEVSIVRATIMSFVGLGALLIGRGYAARQALLLSLLCIILYEPQHLLHDVSLHLSFLATAGIVYLSDTIQFFSVRVQSKTYQEIITTTLAAYIATLPYVIYTFGTISVYALFANVLVLPLVPIAMLLTFLTIVTSVMWSGFGSLFGFLTSCVGDCIIFIARFIEGLPFASVQFSSTVSMMIFMYVCLVIAFLTLVLHTKNSIDETRETKNDEIVSDLISY